MTSYISQSNTVGELPRRGDIDGLRALAVGLVLAFHLGISWVPGGFVGVDVFFVISGYLITGIILRQIEDGRFSILQFSVRRILRIFPALCVVTLTTLLGATILFPPSVFPNLKEAALWAVLGLANLHYWSETSYFAAAAHERPLLHTWSLGVEEQFYLVWPLTLLVLMRLLKLRRSLVFSVVMCVSAIGLVAAELVSRSNPDSAFYLPHLRAWEFAIGALIALSQASLSLSKLGSEIVRGMGVALIVGSAIFLGNGETFPGLTALVPCVGAAALIVPIKDASRISSILAIPLFQGVGLISYSLYLWHWPVFLFVSEWSGQAKLGVIAGCLALVSSMMLAFLTWKYIETPFRRIRPGKPTIAVLPTLFLIGVSGGGGFQIWRAETSSRPPFMEAIVAERLRQASSVEHPQLVFVGDSSCLTGVQPNRIADLTGIKPLLSLCMFGSVGPIGDSRALSILSERGQLPRRVVVMIHPAQFSRLEIDEMWVEYVEAWDTGNSPSPGTALGDGFASGYGTVGGLASSLRKDGHLVDPGSGPRPRDVLDSPPKSFQELYDPLRQILVGLTDVEINFVLAPSPQSMASDGTAARRVAAKALGLLESSILDTPLLLPDDLFASYTHLNARGAQHFSEILAEMLGPLRP